MTGILSEAHLSMKIGTVLSVGVLTFFIWSCRSNSESSSDLQGRPNSGGILKLQKTYEVVVAKDPRLMKGRDIKFLTYAYRDYSFSQFLVEELTANNDPLACDLLDLKPEDAKSLILNVMEETGVEPGFRVFAADIVCEAPALSQE
jgi:hypothetical protein